MNCWNSFSSSFIGSDGAPVGIIGTEAASTSGAVSDWLAICKQLWKDKLPKPKEEK
jgi:hypothetical protein